MPLRVRLSLVVALAVAMLFTGVGVVFLHQLQVGLDGAVDTTLRARADVLSAQVGSPSGVGFQDAGAAGLLPPNEALAQLISANGTVLDSSEGAREVLLTPAQLSQAQGGPLSLTSVLAGGSVRLLAQPVPGAGTRSQVLVVGTSRDLSVAALARARTLFLIAGPLMVTASLVGAWMLAGATLRPVDRMRRQADAITAGDLGAALTVPATRDEVARLGATMNALVQRLQVALSQQRDLVADAGHELRTPLTLLRAELELAIRPHRRHEELVESVTDAVGDVDRLTRLTDDLLLLATADAIDTPVRREPVRIDSLVREVVEQVRRRSLAEGVPTARLDLEPTGPLLVTVEAGDIVRVVTNLLDNALRYAPAASCVGVCVHAAEDPPTVVLDVTDLGPGFPPAFLPHAFERFRRADAARSEGPGGTGLGLSIVASLVHQHGGTVSAYNRPSGGAHVQVRLPRTTR
ncbi:MAG: ATP-binding protein [Actinomycetota bacterium]|nr:ATP-binding protein [Actinomycetota bacterium]